MVTENPRPCNSLAKEADIIPFPNEEVTPPVTKMYLVFFMLNSITVLIKVGKHTLKHPFIGEML
jgi:hypothetical protein